MTAMHRSINEMESVLLSRGGSVLAIQDEGQGRIYQDFSDNLVLEPDVEEPSAEEIAERGDWRLLNHYGVQEHDYCHWLSNVPDLRHGGSCCKSQTWLILEGGMRLLFV